DCPRFCWASHGDYVQSVSLGSSRGHRGRQTDGGDLSAASQPPAGAHPTSPGCVCCGSAATDRPCAPSYLCFGRGRVCADGGGGVTAVLPAQAVAAPPPPVFCRGAGWWGGGRPTTPGRGDL